MKRYLMLICTAFLSVIVLLSGCGEEVSVPVEESTEVTEQTTYSELYTEDETSIKPKIDYEYANKLLGKWSGEEGTVIFEGSNKFTAFNSEGIEYTGSFSVVAASDGNMAISFTTNEDTIRVYTAKFSGKNKIVLINENGKKSELLSGE
ncbi:MAG: hypothetical protein ACI4VF_05190 [Lachnospirales bacterium]